MRVRDFIWTCLATSVISAQAQEHLDRSNGFDTSFLEARQAKAPGKKGIMLQFRLGPQFQQIYTANGDGTNARLLLGNQSNFDYHPNFSQDGKYVVFTSERNGIGNADLFRVRADGSGLEELLATPFVEDQGVLSPDNSMLAYVSTAAEEGQDWKGNIWVMDLASGEKTCLTNSDEVKGESWSPDGYFKPQWSPDGEWIVFSSDRNTGWTGHADGKGWEHTQELSIYAIRPDGTDFRQVVTKPGWCLGAPMFSSDGKRIIYYELLREDTYSARNPPLWNQTVNQIFSVDFATGQDIRQETNTNTLKVSPAYVNNTIAYVTRGGVGPASIYYGEHHPSAFLGGENNPSWSPDGKRIVFEAQDGPGSWKTGDEIFSWQPDWAVRMGPQFPTLSKQGKLAFPNPMGSGITIQFPNGTHSHDIASPRAIANAMNYTGPLNFAQIAWSPDGEWLAFGLGGIFHAREQFTSFIYRVRVDGSGEERLTDGSVNAGFPSYSHDGTKIVYRVWGSEFGLRILDLKANKTTVLTDHTLNDNLPSFAPDGERIVFTRRMNETNFDVCTIRPDGSDLQILTTSAANDAHGVWTSDGRILWCSGQNGWTNEAVTYNVAEQPYGNIWIMDADGGNKRQLTDSIWEDGMPLYLPNELL